jgi:hypothetical protein
METSSSIIPLRFRIDETYLRDKEVSISRFAYEQACKDFLDSMQQLSSRNHPENPPYRRLNTVLTALAPTLAHPFESYRNTDTGHSERQLLVVGEDVKRQPKAEQISDVLYEWGKQWGYQSFENEVNGAGRDAHQRLLDLLQQPAQQWHDIDAAFLFLNLDSGTQMGFKAIPSLLASLLAGRESVINGRTIKWRLTQDGDNGLAVISQPFLAEYQEKNPVTHVVEFKKGTFAYKLEFCLQTQVGSTRPWIHLYVRCSRYVDGPLTKQNWQHDVSVKMGVEQPRLSGWEWSPTLVTLPVAGGKSNPRWDEHLVPLLAAMKARSLVVPSELFLAPLQYREANLHSLYDEYFVLHTEGFKPKHKVKTGFDFAELREVANSVSELLGLELSVGKTLTSDLSTSFMHLDKLPLSMCDIDEFSRKTFTRKHPSQTEDEARRQNRLERQRIVLQALRRAADNQPIVIYLCWSDTFTGKHLKQELYRALFIEEGDPWPTDITLAIPPKPIPSPLLQPLDSGQLDSRDHYKPGVAWNVRQEFKKAWDAQMRQSFGDKTRAWESYLRSIQKNRSGYGMVLIELPKLDEKKYYKDQNIKGAVRRACNKLGLASQMIFPLIPVKKLIADKKDIIPESQGRERNAVADLLYRQTGLMYEQPRGLYSKAGLSQELAEQLHVVGLYKLRKYSPKIHYPIAIRLYPDGTYRVLLPQQSERWLSLIEASKIIGDLFLHRKAQDIDLPDAELARFAAQVFTSINDVPALVMLEAQDWRNYNLLPQFANGKASLQNQLNLTHVKSSERMYNLSDLPNLRIIRLRPIGSLGETPQYVPVLEDEEEQLTEDSDFKRLTGFIDTQAESPFFHYLSIGRMPKTAATKQSSKQSRYKLDEGGGIAFKHQTIVEFVPFFLQPGDDAKAWCHIAHFMRVSPAWDGGNILLPYPLHLAKDLLEDQFCILEGGLDKEE